MCQTIAEKEHQNEEFDRKINETAGVYFVLPTVNMFIIYKKKKSKQ